VKSYANCGFEQGFLIYVLL